MVSVRCNTHDLHGRPSQGFRPSGVAFNPVVYSMADGAPYCMVRFVKTGDCA